MLIRGSGKRRRVTALVLAGAIGLAATGAGAAAQPSRQELEDRIRRLEQIIHDAGLDQPKVRAKARAGAPVTAAPAEPAPDKEQVEAIVEEKLRKQKPVAGWKDGFFLESPGGDFKLKVRGYMQTDARFFPFEAGDTGTDQLYLRRVRPIFEGTVFKYFDYRIMPDFGNGQTVLQDAWMRVNYWSYAQLMAGKMKSPISLERLQGGSELTFIERSIANNLAPNREVAITLGGGLLEDSLNYQIGVFNGQFDGGSNDTDVTSDKDFEGRIFAFPFKTSDWDWAKGFGVGMGGGLGEAKHETINGLQYKTAGRSNFFRFNTSSTVNDFTNGSRTRFSPGAYWYWGPFGMMGEYIGSFTDVQQQTKKKGGATLVDSTLESTGWFVQGSYVLTGEDASYKQVVPINNFDPRNGRWGAFEIAARGSQVDIADDIFRDGLTTRKIATSNALAWTFGVNWYLNKSFKFQLNWEHTNFDNPITFSGTTHPHARDHEDVFISRFQIAY